MVDLEQHSAQKKTFTRGHRICLLKVQIREKAYTYQLIHIIEHYAAREKANTYQLREKAYTYQLMEKEPRTRTRVKKATNHGGKNDVRFSIKMMFVFKVFTNTNIKYVNCVYLRTICYLQTNIKNIKDTSHNFLRNHDSCVFMITGSFRASGKEQLWLLGYVGVWDRSKYRFEVRLTYIVENVPNLDCRPPFPVLQCSNLHCGPPFPPPKP